MQGILKNSGISDREAMIEQMKKMSQPNPQQQQVAQQSAQLDMALKQAEVQKTQAEAQKTTVEAQIAPCLRTQFRPPFPAGEVAPAAGPFAPELP